jgi:multiple sugar transport system ATP-binding protein
MGNIEVEKVSKTYRGSAPVVEDIDLTIEDGEFMVLVGPSGSGKSTLLRMIAGLEEITNGEMRIDGKRVNESPPRDRDLAMVFQNYALYPHMSVEENMAFALKLRKVSKEERKRRVHQAAEILGLEPYLDRKPVALSGGQRQRVAMGRAIVREPKVFLMDEPLSNLDAKLRVSMRGVLAALHDRLKVTTVYVTHDQIEAMTLGDRVAVLADGKLQQVDTPQELYNNPANLFVAGFIGSPAMNMVDAKLVSDGEGLAAVFGSHKVVVPRELLSTSLAAHVDKHIVLGIRPSNFVDLDVETESPFPAIEAKVKATEELGSEINVLFEVDAPPVTHERTKSLKSDSDAEEQAITVSKGHSLFTARLTPATRVKPGGQIRVGIDPTWLHFFDQETGEAITVHS